MDRVIQWSNDGRYDGQVVGEASYQKALRSLASGKRTKVTAHLECEDANKYDRQAVRVMVDDRTVGYLSRKDALVHRKRLKAQNQAGAVVECRAIIVSGDDEIYGVFLDVDYEDEDRMEQVVPESKPATDIPRRVNGYIIIGGLLVVSIGLMCVGRLYGLAALLLLAGLVIGLIVYRQRKVH